MAVPTVLNITDRREMLEKETNKVQSDVDELIDLENMNINQFSRFYHANYEKIQKVMITERLMSTDIFPNLSEHQKMEFLDICYDRFLKSDFYSMVDDFYEYIVIDLLDDYMERLEAKYDFSDSQIKEFINTYGDEVKKAILEGDYDEFFDIMDKNWMWEETRDLTIKDFENMQLSENKIIVINNILKYEELIHITNDRDILAGDNEDYKRFKSNLVDECLDEILQGSDKISDKQLLSFIGELMEVHTDRIAVMAGNYYFCIVDKHTVHTELKNTNITVQVGDCKYKIKKATTFEGSQEIDRIMDTKQELKLSEYRVVETKELEL